MLLVKFIVLLLLGFIVISLFSGLFFLVKDKGQTNRTANALTVRIGLSMVVIVIIMIAGATGIIETNPNPSFQNDQAPVNGDVPAEALGPGAADESQPGGGRRRE